MTDKRINIAYGCSSTIIDLLMISMNSVIQSNKLIAIDFYIVELNFEMQDKRRINSLIDGTEHTVTFINCKNFCSDLNVKSGYILTSWSKLCLYKLNINKVLYLDCDTTIHSSLEKLWDTNIANYYIAGVEDNASLRFRKWIGLNDNDHYINGGVVLMNLEKWRKENVNKKVKNMLEKYNGKIPYSDQGVINSVCNKKIKIISPKYDLMGFILMYDYKHVNEFLNRTLCSKEEFEIARKTPVIVHWVVGPYNRPWMKKCTHPLKKLYEEIAFETIPKLELQDKKIPITIQIAQLLYKVLPFKLYIYLYKKSDFKKYKRGMLSNEKVNA